MQLVQPPDGEKSAEGRSYAVVYRVKYGPEGDKDNLYVGIAGTDSFEAAKADLSLYMGGSVGTTTYFKKVEAYLKKTIEHENAKGKKIGKVLPIVIYGSHSVGATVSIDLKRMGKAFIVNNQKVEAFNPFLEKGYKVLPDENIYVMEGDTLSNRNGAVLAKVNKDKIKMVKRDDNKFTEADKSTLMGYHALSIFMRQQASVDDDFKSSYVKLKTKSASPAGGVRGTPKEDLKKKFLTEMENLKKQREGRALSNKMQNAKSAYDKAIDAGEATTLGQTPQLPQIQPLKFAVASNGDQPQLPAPSPAPPTLRGQTAAPAPVIAAPAPAAAAAAAPAPAPAPTPPGSLRGPPVINNAAPASKQSGPPPPPQQQYIPQTASRWQQMMMGDLAGPPPIVDPDAADSDLAKAQRKAYDAFVPKGNVGLTTTSSTLHDRADALLVPIINTLFHSYNKSFNGYRADYGGKSTRKILLEFFGAEAAPTLGRDDMQRLNMAILRNYASLWNVDAAALIDSIEPFSLTRTLCILVCRYREITSTGENLHGLVARIAKAGDKTDASSGDATTVEETTTSGASAAAASPSPSTLRTAATAGLTAAATTLGNMAGGPTVGAGAGAAASATLGAGGGNATPPPTTATTNITKKTYKTSDLLGKKNSPLQPFEDLPDEPTKSYEDDHGYSFLSGGLLDASARYQLKYAEPKPQENATQEYHFGDD